VRPLGVEVLDLEEVARRRPMRILAGWESKVFAVQHAPYEEVLFLDADNLPARDPSFLFDEPLYRQTGAVFWPDLPPTTAPSGSPTWSGGTSAWSPGIRSISSRASSSSTSAGAGGS
jgi:hypothetical protein